MRKRLSNWGKSGEECSIQSARSEKYKNASSGLTISRTPQPKNEVSGQALNRNPMKPSLPMLFPLLATVVALWTAPVLASGTQAGSHHPAQFIGQPGKKEAVQRTITIRMLDTMRFEPALIRVKKGETLRLVVTNVGKVKHELILGTEKDIIEHNALMKLHPEMEHADDHQVTVQAGQSAEIIWQFTRSGKVHFVCLQPGHYNAGMRGQVLVTDYPQHIMRTPMPPAQ